MEEEKKDKAVEEPVKEKKTSKKTENALQKVTAEKEALEAELKAAKDQYQRMLAEYANYKRRTEQEKEQIGEFTKAEILKGLLPSVDNMERALQAEESGDYKTGVEMTVRGFFDAMKALGLEEIEAEGCPFNPEIHNAVMREDAEDTEAETVTQVFQKGYRVGDRVLRPAMVKVAN